MTTFVDSALSFHLYMGSRAGTQVSQAGLELAVQQRMTLNYRLGDLVPGAASEELIPLLLSWTICKMEIIVIFLQGVIGKILGQYLAQSKSVQGLLNKWSYVLSPCPFLCFFQPLSYTSSHTLCSEPIGPVPLSQPLFTEPLYRSGMPFSLVAWHKDTSNSCTCCPSFLLCWVSDCC